MTDADPICVVPARGTSPTLPKKHFKELAGKPLVAHTIETGLEVFDDVFVTTESEALAERCREYGARVPSLRPASLAAPDVHLDWVVHQLVEELRALPDVRVEDGGPVVILQSNVPLRRPAEIERALDRFRAGHESVISVVEERRFHWQTDGDRLEPRFEARRTRDELEPYYRETGSINVTTPRLLREGRRVTERPGYVVTDQLSALAVDSVVDLWLAERIADGPTVVFRVDGGPERGMGHVERCLTLARGLSERLRCSVRFVSAADATAGVEHVREAGFRAWAAENPAAAVRELDPDLAVLDVLDTDPEQVRALHECAAAVVNLEDLAGGLDHADVVVNALYEEGGEETNHHAGADYFMLREEFADHQPTPDSTPAHLLVTFGGSDPNDLSVQAVRALGDAGLGLDVRLVLGPGFDGHGDLRALPERYRAGIEFVEEPEMGDQARWADLAVSSGGRTAYELAATGTPTIVLAQNDREHRRMRALDAEGVVDYLGRGEAVSDAALVAAVERLRDDANARIRLSERGRAHVDGGGARRVLDLVHELLVGRG